MAVVLLFGGGSNRRIQEKERKEEMSSDMARVAAQSPGGNKKGMKSHSTTNREGIDVTKAMHSAHGKGGGKKGKK